MSLFSNLSIQYKIMSIALVSIIGFGINFIVSFSVAQDNSRHLHDLDTVIYPTLAVTEKNRVRMDTILVLLDEVVRTEELDLLDDADDVIALMQQSFQDITVLDRTKTATIENLTTGLNDYYALAKPLTVNMLAGSIAPAEMNAQAQQMQVALKAYRNNLDKFLKTSQSAFANVIESANETVQFSLILSAMIGLFLIVVLASTAFLVASGITRNIRQVSNNLQEIANGDGDLTHRLAANNHDEVGQLVNHFNTFMDKLQSMIKELTGYSAHVGSAAEELSNIAQQSRTGIDSQRSEAEQVATASNEMTATIVEVAKNAEQAAQAATTAHNAATEGNQVVNKTIEIINQLAGDVGNGSTAVNQLRDDSESIGTVLDVIRGIAEQTNLLALNAAIEAARAGEQGRGFAVVADEVRTLASRTQESTLEIQSMIEKLQSSAGQATEIMNRGQATSESGVKEAALAGEALHKITESVSVISNMNEQIASAAEEQSAVASEIDKNIVNISQSSDSNAENISQLANAGSSLNNVAIQMQELIGQFKV